MASQGGNVYSFGGISNDVAVANAYNYSPATNTWTPIASLPQPRGWFSATTDGTYIYLLGGVDQNFTTTATLWRYDPISNTYNTSLPSYTIPTYFHASVYLDGKIYRIAGRAIGTDFHVEVYDIATNSWSMAANYPFANHSLMAAALGNYIYAGGGNASPDKTWRYQPNTDTGMMRISPICLRAARLPPPERTMAGGYLQEATSTSRSAPARSRGIGLPTPGTTCKYGTGPRFTRRRNGRPILLRRRRQLCSRHSDQRQPAVHRNLRYRDTNTDCDSNQPTHRYINSDGNGHLNCNSYANAYTYGYGNTNRDGDSNSYTYFDTETFTNAEIRADTEAATHSITAPVGRAIGVNRPYLSARPIRFRPSANISVFTPIPMRK